MRDDSSWTIQDVARATGLTSRTLRLYGDIGLLPASSTEAGGIRRYDDAALLTLQRILLLRDLGLPLAVIGEVIDDDGGDAVAHLRTHLDLLQVERSSLDRRILAVRRTIEAREGDGPMTSEMFDGFDHPQHEEEVARRWGAQSYADGDRWWRGLTADDRRAFAERVAQLNSDWVQAARDGEAPDGDRARALAARHVAWLASTPGAPAPSADGAGAEARAAYLRGLGEMYVADPRFGRNYTAEDVPDGAAFVRDVLAAYAASGAVLAAGEAGATDEAVTPPS